MTTMKNMIIQSIPLVNTSLEHLVDLTFYLKMDDLVNTLYGVKMESIENQLKKHIYKIKILLQFLSMRSYALLKIILLQKIQVMKFSHWKERSAL